MLYAESMERVSIKQVAAFFGVIALIIAVFVLGADFFLKWWSGNSLNDEVPTPYVPSGAHQIKSPESALAPSVIYDGMEFQPSKTMIDGSGPLGCIIVLENRSALPLKIGISPHASGADPGPDYKDIAPGSRLIFDPRFTGIAEISFHDHSVPSREFTVILGSKCQI